MNTVAKLALSLGAIGFALSGATAQAQTNVISDPVGFYKVNIVAGANAFSTPLHNIQAFRGVVSSVVGNSINFSGSPSFAASQFAPVTVAGSPRAQYIALVRKDADKADGATNNITGDWWTISANSTTNVTVVPGGDNLSVLLAAGDEIEIRKLTSLKDIFGSASDYKLNKDADGSTSKDTTDVIAILDGTSFAEQWSYWEIPGFPAFNGYGGPDQALDGSQITLLPSQPVVVYRLAGSPATNVTVLGQVQTKRLTQYLDNGANSVGNPFPASGQFATSGLAETSGWVADTSGAQDPSDSDVVRRLSGTAFDQTMSFLFTGTPAFDGWFDGANFQSTATIDPSRAYVVYIKPGTGPIKWRQNVPFNP